MLNRRFIVSAAVGATLALTACQDNTLAPDVVDGLNLAKSGGGGGSSGELATMLDDMNAALAVEGEAYRAVMVEYITEGSVDQANTVISKDVGNKQLSFDYVPGDTRRAWSGSDPNTIEYAIDQTGDAVPVFGGLTAAMTDAAIVRAMDTWDAASCSDLGLSRSPDFGIDIGVVAFQISGGAVGSPFIFADLQHAGWRDLNFGGGVIGATFTFGFIDVSQLPNVVFTDVDNNNKADAAFREIYYDPSFSWADDGVSNVDVESVALHEAGHGLSQAHFGKVFIKRNGSLQFAPRAVMNAVYVSPQADLFGTDNGGHCSNWGQWPNN